MPRGTENEVQREVQVDAAAAEGLCEVHLDEALQLDRQKLSVVRVRSGVVVASTTAGAIDSAEGGLAPVDVIYAVNGKAVASLADLRTTLDGLKAGDPVVLQLERRTALLYLTFTAE